MYEIVKKVIFIAGPTASGKSKEAIRLAKLHHGEVISVDSRQVYRELDIGTEKMTHEEMGGVPHHLIDIRDVEEVYSAGDFVNDATRLIEDMHVRGVMPILAGGTHFYFDALLYGLPEVERNDALRTSLETYPNEELHKMILEKNNVSRNVSLDVNNRRRLIRALEVIDARGQVPARVARTNEMSNSDTAPYSPYNIEWIIIDPSREELRERIDARLKDALTRGLIEEVRRVQDDLISKMNIETSHAKSVSRATERLNELGLEYRIVAEYLRGERDEDSLFPSLSAKLWQYAKRQKAWLRKLKAEHDIENEH